MPPTNYGELGTDVAAQTDLQNFRMFGDKFPRLVRKRKAAAASAEPLMTPAGMPINRNSVPPGCPVQTGKGYRAFLRGHQESAQNCHAYHRILSQRFFFEVLQDTTGGLE
jgi:hypothetical protein